MQVIDEAMASRLRQQARSSARAERKAERKARGRKNKQFEIDGRCVSWISVLTTCARDVGLEPNAGAKSIALAICEKLMLPYTNPREIIKEHALRLYKLGVQVHARKKKAPTRWKMATGYEGYAPKKIYQRPKCIPSPGAPHPNYKSDPDFYSSREWREVRYLALVKAQGRCQCCGARASDGATLHVDHVIPRYKAPQLALDPSNLQVLCADCNLGKGAWDATDWRPSP